MPPPCTTLQTSQRPSSGCLHGQGGAASREGVLLWRRHSHFAMTYRKGKANFHLRVLVHSRKDHDHGSGHFLKPEGRAEEKWAGMRLPAVHCQQWTRHREKGTTKVTMPMTVQGQYCLRSKHTGSALLGGGRQKSSPEVLLQSWGYGRIRTGTSPWWGVPRRAKADRLSSSSSSSMGLQHRRSAPPTPRK